MKVVLKDFEYLGEHIEEFEWELPQVKDLDEDMIGEIFWYVLEQLNDFVAFQNSFKYEKAH